MDNQQYHTYVTLLKRTTVSHICDAW